MSTAAAFAAFSFGPSQCQSCQADGSSCSTSNGITSGWMKTTIDTSTDVLSSRSGSPILGSGSLFPWSSRGRDLSHLKVSVAADYSDSSFPDSSSYTSARGYHPLEEVIVSRRRPEPQLTPAEIARTTVEANSGALVVFPGIVHREPHEEITWAELQYVVDDYGEIYFEMFDDRNVLRDPQAGNAVNAFIGMDVPVYENRRVASDIAVFNVRDADDIPIENDYFPIMDYKDHDVPVDWGMPDTCTWVHPIHFAKCLSKATDIEHDIKMGHPSNGVSIIGCLKPAFDDEEAYFRSVCYSEDSDGYSSDSTDGEIPNLSSKKNVSRASSIYRFEIISIELFSVYGTQRPIGYSEYQKAEADVLLNCVSTIIERFNDRGIDVDSALKALCKKKGIDSQEAHLIGVDSLGLDVRICSGVEVRTHRFPFKIRARSEVAAEKQIHQLLFPRSRRKKRNQGDRLRDSRSR
ncbi:unnamed protein product [Linum tenue]|uniref:Uncharacterized protein n=1 Tax=Linum tenue TaxID=586396 RepID=A0AAV0IJW0_9ROSI|nr:unnamed protein product [Linum tenue]